MAICARILAIYLRKIVSQILYSSTINKYWVEYLIVNQRAVRRFKINHGKSSLAPKELPCRVLPEHRTNARKMLAAGALFFRATVV